MPNYTDVVWDHGAAANAAAALNRAAYEVEQAAADGMAVSQLARVAWFGSHRANFDLRREYLVSQSRALAADCRTAAAAIMAADQRAREEQARREREREEWEREQEEEERRRRARSNP